MPEPTTYEIVIKGRAAARLLRPLLDDFALDHSGHGVTRLIGDVRDPAHLHGVVSYLTSVNAELISIAPLVTVIEPAIQTPSTQTPSTQTSSQHEWNSDS